MILSRLQQDAVRLRLGSFMLPRVQRDPQRTGNKVVSTDDQFIQNATGISVLAGPQTDCGKMGVEQCEQ